MTEKIKQMGSLDSIAEDLFVELFCDTFGPDQAQYLFLQYPVTDIYGISASVDNVYNWKLTRHGYPLELNSFLCS